MPFFTLAYLLTEEVTTVVDESEFWKALAIAATSYIVGPLILAIFAYSTRVRKGGNNNPPQPPPQELVPRIEHPAHMARTEIIRGMEEDIREIKEDIRRIENLLLRSPFTT